MLINQDAKVVYMDRRVPHMRGVFLCILRKNRRLNLDATSIAIVPKATWTIVIKTPGWVGSEATAFQFRIRDGSIIDRTAARLIMVPVAMITPWRLRSRRGFIE